MKTFLIHNPKSGEVRLFNSNKHTIENAYTHPDVTRFCRKTTGEVSIYEISQQISHNVHYGSFENKDFAA